MALSKESGQKIRDMYNAGLQITADASATEKKAASSVKVNSPSMYEAYQKNYELGRISDSLAKDSSASGVYSAIDRLSKYEPKKANDLMATFLDSRLDPSSKYYSPALNTRSTVRSGDVNLADFFGVDTFDADWIRKNSGLTQYLQYTAAGNVQAPTAKSTDMERAAYYYYQIQKNEANTRELEQEWSDLQKELAGKAKDNVLYRNDDERIESIDWSKYKKLQEYAANNELYIDSGLNRPVMYTGKDDLYGVLWAAKNGGEVGRTDIDYLAYSAQRKTDEANATDRLANITKNANAATNNKKSIGFVPGAVSNKKPLSYEEFMNGYGNKQDNEHSAPVEVETPVAETPVQETTTPVNNKEFFSRITEIRDAFIQAKTNGITGMDKTSLDLIRTYGSAYEKFEQENPELAAAGEDAIAQYASAELKKLEKKNEPPQTGADLKNKFSNGGIGEEEKVYYSEMKTNLAEADEMLQTQGTETEKATVQTIGEPGWKAYYDYLINETGFDWDSLRGKFIESYNRYAMEQYAPAKSAVEEAKAGLKRIEDKRKYAEESLKFFNEKSNDPELDLLRLPSKDVEMFLEGRYIMDVGGVDAYMEEDGEEAAREQYAKQLEENQLVLDTIAQNNERIEKLDKKASERTDYTAYELYSVDPADVNKTEDAQKYVEQMEAMGISGTYLDAMKGRVKTLEQRDVYAGYQALDNKPDFAELSEQDFIASAPQEWGMQTQDPTLQKALLLMTPEERKRFNYIGNSAETKKDGVNAALHYVWNLERDISTITMDEATEYLRLKDEEGELEAEKYLATRFGTLEERERAVLIQGTEELTKEHPVLANAMSVLSKMGDAMLTPAKIMVALTGDRELYDNINGLSDFGNTVRSQTSQMIESEFGKFVYNSGMSIADNLAAMGVGKLMSVGTKGIETITQLIMSSSAASAELDKSVNAGMNGVEAVFRAVLSGGIEALAEKFELDALLDSPTKTSAINYVAYILQNSFTEGTGEGASDILGLAADAIVSSIFDHETEFDQLVKEHGGDRGSAFDEWMKGVGLDMAAGSFAGLIMSSGNTAINVIEEAYYNKQMRQITAANHASALEVLMEAEGGGVGAQTTAIAVALKKMSDRVTTGQAKAAAVKLVTKYQERALQFLENFCLRESGGSNTNPAMSDYGAAIVDGILADGSNTSYILDGMLRGAVSEDAETAERQNALVAAAMKESEQNADAVARQAYETEIAEEVGNVIKEGTFKDALASAKEKVNKARSAFEKAEMFFNRAKGSVDNLGAKYSERIGNGYYLGDYDNSRVSLHAQELASLRRANSAYLAANRNFEQAQADLQTAEGEYSSALGDIMSEARKTAISNLANRTFSEYNNNQGGESNAAEISAENGAGNQGNAGETEGLVPTRGEPRNQPDNGMDQGRVFGTGDSASGTRFLLTDSQRSSAGQKGVPDLKLASSPDNLENFSQSLDNAIKTNAHGAYVSPHTAEELREDGGHAFLSESGKEGVFVFADGNIGAVFKDGSSTAKHAVDDLMLTALQNGGNKLDNYSGVLNRLYSRFGFVPVARCQFMDEYAPEGWNFERDSRPDIVFWMHNGDSVDTVIDNLGTYEIPSIESLPLFTGEDGYSNAEAYRDNMLNQRIQANTAPVDANPAVSNAQQDNVQNGSQTPQNGIVSYPDNPQNRPMNAGTGQRQFNTQTAPESGRLKAETNELLAENAEYQRDTNKSQNERAIARIESMKSESDPTGYNNAKALVLYDSHFDAKTTDGVALYSAVMDMAIANGDAQGEADLALKWGEVREQMGRAFQALKLFDRMSAKGRENLLEKIARNTNEQLAKKKYKKAVVEVTDEMRDIVKKANTKEEIDAAFEQCKQMMADQLPPTIKEKLDAWRFFAMLGNPKTVIKNYVGNVTMLSAARMKDVVASEFEQTEPNTFYRTHSGFVKKEYKNFARAYVREGIDAARGTGKYNPTSKSGVLDKRTVWKSKAMQKADAAVTWLLDNNYFGDGFFLGANFRHAFGGYLQAKGVDVSNGASNIDTKVLNAAFDYAVNEAQRNTYRDASKVADLLNQIDKNSFGGFVINSIVPFKKTPINVAKRAIEYSPVGLVNGLRKVGQAVKNGDGIDTAVDRVAAGITGTGILALGALASACGLVVVNGIGDDKEGSFDKGNGHQNYSVEICGKSITIDNLGILAMNFLVGAKVHDILMDAESVNANNAMSKIAESCLSITAPMRELTFLDSLESAIENANYSESGILGVVTTAAQSFVLQFIPTAVGAIAQTIDDKRRVNYSDKKFVLGSDASYTLEKAENKIPGLRETNEVYVNQWGEENPTKGVAERFLQNFLVPAYWNTITEDDVDKEIKRLSVSLDDSSVIINLPKRGDMTSKQYHDYSETRGQAAKQALRSIMNTVEYEAMDDVMRKSVVTDVYNYATEVAKNKVLGNDYQTKWIANAEKNGNVVDVILGRCKDKAIQKENEYYMQSMYDSIDSMDDEAFSNSIAALKRNGKTESSIKSSITSHYKDDFISAYNAGNMEEAIRIRDILVNTGLYEVKDLEKWVK